MMEIELDFMVIPLFCSSGRESKYRSCPASFLEIMLLLDMS